MNQKSLFDFASQAAAADCRDAETIPTCRERETGTSLSQMADSRTLRRLVSLAEQARRTPDLIDQARIAAELRDVAESVVEDDIRRANESGMTWRAIGARLGIPFQTLYRRYGADR